MKRLLIILFIFAGIQLFAQEYDYSDCKYIRPPKVLNLSNSEYIAIAVGDSAYIGATMPIVIDKDTVIISDSLDFMVRNDSVFIAKSVFGNKLKDWKYIYVSSTSVDAWMTFRDGSDAAEWEIRDDNDVFRINEGANNYARITIDSTLITINDTLEVDKEIRSDVYKNLNSDTVKLVISSDTLYGWVSNDTLRFRCNFADTLPILFDSLVVAGGDADTAQYTLHGLGYSWAYADSAFVDSLHVKMFSIGDSIAHYLANGDTIATTLWVANHGGSGGNSDTSLVATEDLGTALDYADTAWVNIVLVADSLVVSDTAYFAKGIFTGEITSAGSETVFNENSADKDFRIETNGNANMFFSDGGNDRIGIGLNAPCAKFHISADGTTPAAALYNSTTDNLLLTNNASAALLRIVNASSTASEGSALVLLRTKGTLASPTVVASGDRLGSVTALGYDGDSREEGASIRFEVDGTPGASNDFPGRMTFYTTPDGSATPAERMRITNAGRIGIATTAPDNLFDINLGTAGKFQLTYDDANGSAANYTTFEVNSAGMLSITSVDGSAANGDIYLNPDGYVGIEDNTPSYTLDVTGEINATTAYRLDGSVLLGHSAKGNVSGAVECDASTANTFSMTATGNITALTLTNTTLGVTYVITITQDGTGSRTCTFSTGFDTQLGGEAAINSEKSSVSVITIFDNGASNLYNIIWEL